MSGAGAHNKFRESSFSVVLINLNAFSLSSVRGLRFSRLDGRDNRPSNYEVVKDHGVCS